MDRDYYSHGNYYECCRLCMVLGLQPSLVTLLVRSMLAVQVVLCVSTDINLVQ